MKLVPSSLRQRLVLAAVAVGVVFAILFGATALWQIHRAEDQAIGAALLSRAELARDELTPTGSLSQDAGSPKTDLVQVIGPDGATRANSPALAGVPPLVDIAQVRGQHRVRTQVALQRPDVDLAVLAVPLRLAGGNGSPAGVGALVVAVDAEGFNTAATGLLTLLVVGLLVVVMTMAALSWILTGRALGNVTRLTENAEAVRARDLAKGLPVPPGDVELTRLVAALNRMLERLHESHSAELAFAADAGHRLRTPVATLRAEAELALDEQDPAELRAALKRILGDADHLTSVVERMLMRIRNRVGTSESVATQLDADAARWRRRAELASATLHVDVDPQVPTNDLCPALDAVLEPIVDNAIRHTPAAGTITISVRLADADDDRLEIDVVNTGSAVPADVGSRVFDAWVSTRDASVAGGLGLWLAREAARDVGGDVRLVDGAQHTTFRALLPIESR